ncbi:response regulator transcription factor [Caulobacter sp. FWC2]|uniref:response regulator transcription factor n=1 Tax=Caulobacter sp. FWC2 TaxID=69664 RepID=UPI000C160AAC|nr:response regulator transcription factor [Caulobacter sp. FWC2]PIB90581.1 DNA-binding response regulator [Caulobacter sp. FWC2]
MIRVVVAEDQGLVLRALVALIELAGDIVVVGSASNGSEALSMVDDLKPDVLVSDIEMPGLSGLEIAEALAPRKSNTRVLIVTTFGRAGYLRRALDAGVRGYLLKDSPDDVLAHAIRVIAAGGRAIAPDLRDAIWDTPVDPLNARERAVLSHADKGASTAEMARALSLTPGTVRNYLSEALQKLGARNRVEAARIARENGWI